MEDKLITSPHDIEERSFSIIQGELRSRNIVLGEDIAPIVTRVIHATADLDYAGNMVFTPDVVPKTVAILRKTAPIIVTDTLMAQVGIDTSLCRTLGIDTRSYIKDDSVKESARIGGVTRSSMAILESIKHLGGRPVIYAIGNAPTALLKLCDIIQGGLVSPALVIGVPVGFVNVVYAKTRLMSLPISYIVTRGNKGGSTVAVAIVNALLHMAAPL